MLPRDLELRDLDVAIAVADAHAFRRAAQTLGIETSAVSRRVRALEDRLGASLFERRRSGTWPTDAGERFLNDARLWDFQANLDGAQKIVTLLRPLVQARNPALLKRVDDNFAKVDAILARYKEGEGFKNCSLG